MSQEKQLREKLAKLLLANNTPQELIDFCSVNGRIRHYSPKQYLYFSGDVGNSVYVLINGRIQLSLTNEFVEKTIRIISPPSFFPEVVLDGKSYPHSALCTLGTDVLVIDRLTLLSFAEQNPTVLLHLFRGLALDLRRSYRQVRNLSIGDARLRLGAKLFALAHVHGKHTQKGVVVTIPLSVTDLANMCSLARESVSRILTELKDLSLIEFNKKAVTVLNIEGLRIWIRTRTNR